MKQTARVNRASLCIRTLALVIAVLGISFADTAQASNTINKGFDLFQTAEGSNFYFDGVPNPQFVTFKGNPLGAWDFGHGLVNVGNTDTIIERTTTADVSPLGMAFGLNWVDIEMRALSLVSTTPVDLGLSGGPELIYITLNTSSPSIQSTMTIGSTGEGQPHGLFDSVLNFYFDVTGSVGGFYVGLEKTIIGKDVPWQHAPTGTLRIPGVNIGLNHLNDTTDFWTSGIVIHDDGTGTAIHKVFSANIPEPSGLALAAFGFIGLAALGWRRPFVFRPTCLRHPS